MGFWVFIYALSMIGDKATNKLTSVVMDGENRSTYYSHCAIRSLVACLFFFMLGGFSISINTKTLLFSLGYGLSILAYILINLFSLRFMNVLGAGILSTPLNLILTAVMGVLLWEEDITLSRYLAIILTSVSALLIFIDIRHLAKQDNKGKSDAGRVNLKAYIPLMLLSVVFAVIQNLFLKAFAISTDVTDENSFYFLTNFVILAWGLIMLGIQSFSNIGEVKTGLKSFFTFKRALPSVSNVLLGNVAAIALMPILKEIEISNFTPLSSAYMIIVSVFVSLLFKERLGIFSYISALVAIAAMFV